MEFTKPRIDFSPFEFVWNSILQNGCIPKNYVFKIGLYMSVYACLCVCVCVCIYIYIYIYLNGIIQIEWSM